MNFVQNFCYNEKARETALKSFKIEKKENILKGVISRNLHVLPPLKEVLE